MSDRLHQQLQALQGEIGEATAHAKFKANKAAWKFFESQPPGYRKIATYWVVSAKREDTRAKRLATLIEDSAAGRRIAQLRRESK